MPTAQVAEACSVIDTIQLICLRNHFGDAGSALGRVCLAIGNIDEALPDVSTMIGYLSRVSEVLMTDLRKFHFIAIAPEQIKYFEQKHLFGESVFDSFNDAREEIKDAGNSFALGLYDATVFYLMRISEHGLRYLARKLKVKLTDKGKRQPLEHADWTKIITKCKESIDKSRKAASGPQKNNKLQLYSEAADHCEYIKDIWRNDSAHTRKRYIQPEALAAMDRVRDFMNCLADKALTK